MENSYRTRETETYVEIYPDNFNNNIVTIQKHNNFYSKIFSNDYNVSKIINDLLSYEPKGVRFRKIESSWDGKTRFFIPKNKQFPTGFKKIVIEELLRCGYAVFVDKQTKAIKYVGSIEDFESKINTWKLKGIKLYKYQIEAAYYSFKYNRLFAESLTGSGKSLIIYILFRYYLQYVNNKAKIILSTPYGHLIDQMIKEFSNYEDDGYLSSRISNRFDDMSKNICILGYQMLNAIEDPKIRQKILESVECVVIDEAHITGFDKYIRKCKNLKILVGLTGTIKETKENMYRIYNFFFHAMKFNDYETLSKQGIVSKVKLNVINVEYKNIPNYITDYIEMRSDPKADPEIINRPNFPYKFEIDYIFDKLNIKKDLVCGLANKIATKNKNVLILFYSELKYIKLFYQHFFDLYDTNAYYVDGSVTDKNKEHIKDVIENSTGNVIFSSSVFATGTNIKNINDIILAYVNKSKNFTLQSIGRGMRVHASKDYLSVWDIVDNMPPLKENEYNPHCYSVMHFKDRLKYYKQQKYELINHSITDLEIAKNFDSLVANITNK